MLKQSNGPQAEQKTVVRRTAMVRLTVILQQVTESKIYYVGGIQGVAAVQHSLLGSLVVTTWWDCGQCIKSLGQKSYLSSWRHRHNTIKKTYVGKVV